MRSIAYLTTSETVEFPIYDRLTFEPLRRLGFEVETHEWRADEDWGRFAAVLPRSTWDYHFHPEEFFAALERVDASGAELFNRLEVIRWNAHKGYLKELADAGVRVVETRYGKRLDPDVIRQMREELGPDLVIKPVVSASAAGTFRLDGDEAEARAIAALDGREWMVQPFMRGVVEEGEYSLVYFDGVFSHALQKQARSGDYRVQERHGGTIRPVEADARMLQRGHEVLDALPGDLLYARIDLVPAGGDFELMEAELIEPSLYLSMHPEAPERFARALAGRLGAGA